MLHCPIPLHGLHGPCKKNACPSLRLKHCQWQSHYQHWAEDADNRKFHLEVVNKRLDSDLVVDPYHGNSGPRKSQPRQSWLGIFFREQRAGGPETEKVANIKIYVIFAVCESIPSNNKVMVAMRILSFESIPGYNI